MNFSKYQSVIFERGQKTKDNLIIRASAGSGKTTTLIELSKRLPFYEKSIFVAFNKSIVDELKRKIGSNITCATIHSLGFKALINYYRIKFKTPSKYKTLIFVNEKIKRRKEDGTWKDEWDDKEKFVYQYNLMDMINLIRMNQIPLDIESINKLCDYYDIIPLYGEVEDSIDIMNSIAIYNKSFDKKNNVIDFTDMVAIPALDHNIYMEQYDNVLIDEVQDLNIIQHKFIERLLKPGGRLIACGDKNQMIYNFMGADVFSYEKILNRKNTVELPLTISYRCGKNIVKKAQEIYPEIEEYEFNEDGEVRYADISEITEGDMVICRNNRPLVSLYFSLLENEKSAYIVGRDIENGIKVLLTKVKNMDILDAMEKLKEELSFVAEQLINKGVKKFEQHPTYIKMYEKIKTIEIIGKRYRYIWEVEKKLEEMFSEKSNSIKLMTIHKSKGLENDRVFLIERFDGNKLLPSPYAKKDWEIVQETNLEFVAYTRAKKSLLLIKNL